METRANYVVVGIFTLAAILAAFGFVYWTSGIGDRGEVATLRFRIHGSASGLVRGSVVLFNGVKVGDVSRVYIDVSNPTVAIADAIVDRLTPITRSTLADVGLAGLTGQANIEMRGGDPAEPNLLDLAEAEGTIAEITANPSAVANLLESAQNIFRRADNVLSELEELAVEARGPITETLRNVETFSGSLARNADGIDAFLANVTTLSTSLAGASDRIDTTLAAVEGLIEAVDRDQVAAVVGNVERFTRRLDESSGDLDKIMADVDAAIASLARFSASANETLAKVDGVIDSVDPAAVRTALTNFEQASAGINRAAGDIGKVTETVGARAEDIDRIISDAQQLAARLNQASERVDGLLAKVDGVVDGVDPEALRALLASLGQAGDNVNAMLGRVDEIISGVDAATVRTALTNFEQASTTINRAASDVGKVTETVSARTEDIDRIISDAQQLAARLNQASERIDGVLARVDDLLGSGEAEGVMAEAGETLKAFRQVADTLNARMGTITDGLARFSGQGLRDVEALVRDARRSITRIEQAVTDLERNPQRILSGGAGQVRQFDGRARR